MTDHITVIGNVATTPEKTRTATGISITKFRLATTRRRQDDSGAWVDDHTNWYQISVFRGLADHAFDSLQKGHRVIVTGRLKIDKWENGEKHGTEVAIDADAVGHDLLWGTSTFHKGGRAESASTTTEAPAPTSADELEADGVDEAGADTPWGRELVGAAAAPDAWSVAPLGEQP